MIREAIITTLAADGGAHITPLGFREDAGRVVLAPFVPSITLENLRRQGVAVLNFTEDVRIFAGCLTGRRQWPVLPAELSPVPRLADSLAHWELAVEAVEDHPERPRFFCTVLTRVQHHAFSGFNRAQAAVVEGAILISRLDWLDPSQVAAEMRYLQIAVDKTAGERERLAWHWLQEAVAAHPRHRRSAQVDLS